MDCDGFVRHAGLRRMTVLDCTPDSRQAEHDRAPARRIHDNKGRGVIPTPVGMDGLEDRLLSHGLLENVDESLIGKTRMSEQESPR